MKVDTPDDLTSIVLDEAKPDQVAKIGAQLPLAIKTQLASFLREFKDVFAWTHADMPGIDPNVIVHRLNDDKTIAEKVQARRAFNPERYLAINEEVENFSPLVSSEKPSTPNGWPMWSWSKSLMGSGAFV